MAKKGEVKVGRGSAPAREISFVSLVAYGPKVFYLALAMGDYSFLNQAGWFPTDDYEKKRKFCSISISVWSLYVSL